MEKNVGSIRQIHNRLIKEGYHISEYAIRIWIKTGQLKAAYVGVKALVSYSAVLRLIEGLPDSAADTAV